MGITVIGFGYNDSAQPIGPISASPSQRTLSLCLISAIARTSRSRIPLTNIHPPWTLGQSRFNYPRSTPWQHRAIRPHQAETTSHPGVAKHMPGVGHCTILTEERILDGGGPTARGGTLEADLGFGRTA